MKESYKSNHDEQINLIKQLREEETELNKTKIQLDEIRNQLEQEKTNIANESAQQKDNLAKLKSEKESLEYIATRYKKISRRQYFRVKKQILSDQEINDFFNHHARIGFVLDHKKRRDEMELVLGYLMKRWLSITEGNLFRFTDMTRLAETIIHVSQRAEEITLSNSVIFKIKRDLEEVVKEKNRTYQELRELNPNLSQSKF